MATDELTEKVNYKIAQFSTSSFFDTKIHEILSLDKKWKKITIKQCSLKDEI